MQKTFFTLMGILAFCGLSFTTWAENSTSVQGYVIHHNAFTADTLSADIATNYQLTRSKNRGILNVSVIQEVPNSTGKAVKAEVTANATNLSGQHREVPLREIVDGDAVYYIGEFRIANQETLNFVIEVQPEGSTDRHTAKFSQQFFH